MGIFLIRRDASYIGSTSLQTRIDNCSSWASCVASPDCGAAGGRSRTRIDDRDVVVSVECAPSLVRENPRL
jgi:hypothetical protein